VASGFTFVKSSGASECAPPVSKAVMPTIRNGFALMA
jgi:hypothetical protein